MRLVCVQLSLIMITNHILSENVEFYLEILSSFCFNWYIVQNIVSLEYGHYVFNGAVVSLLHITFLGNKWKTGALPRLN